MQKLFPFIRSLRWELTFWFGGLSLIFLLSGGFYVGNIATEILESHSGEDLYLRAKSATDLLETNLREREKEIALLARSPLFVESNLGSDVVRQAMLLAKKLPNDTPVQPLRFIDFAAPIKGPGGEIRGVLGAHAHWRWVTDTVESVMTADLAESGIELLIADANDNVIYPFAHVGNTDLPKASPSLGENGRVRWADGQEYLTAITEVDMGPDPGLGWRIIARQPVTTALAPAEALRNHLWLLGLLTVLVFAVIAHRLAARLSRPIEQLASAARTVAQRNGNPEYPANVRTWELKQLVDSIHHMTDSLLKQEREMTELNLSLKTRSLSAQGSFPKPTGSLRN